MTLHSSFSRSLSGEEEIGCTVNVSVAYSVVTETREITRVQSSEEPDQQNN